MEAVCLVCTAPLREDSSVPACPACLARLRKTLDQLPVLYVRLHTELPHHTARRLDPARIARLPWKYRPAPLPLRMSLLAHAEHTVSTVRTWALHTLPQAVPDTPVRPGRLLQHLCSALAQDLPASLQPPVRPDHPQAVWDAYLRSLRLLHQDDAPQRLSTPCPTCDLRSLYHDNAGTTCRSCHSRFPYARPA